MCACVCVVISLLLWFPLLWFFGRLEACLTCNICVTGVFWLDRKRRPFKHKLIVNVVYSTLWMNYCDGLSLTWVCVSPACLTWLSHLKCLTCMSHLRSLVTSQDGCGGSSVEETSFNRTLLTVEYEMRDRGLHRLNCVSVCVCWYTVMLFVLTFVYRRSCRSQTVSGARLILSWQSFRRLVSEMNHYLC